MSHRSDRPPIWQKAIEGFGIHAKLHATTTTGSIDSSRGYGPSDEVIADIRARRIRGLRRSGVRRSMIRAS